MNIIRPSMWNAMKLGSLAALALLLSLLSGCAEQQPIRRVDLPESIGNNGLVLAEVQGLGRLAPFGEYAEVKIKDGTNSILGATHSKLHSHYLIESLAPGHYTIAWLQRGSVIPGSQIRNNVSTTLPLNVEFTVRAGEVTNLGQLLLIPDEQDAERKRFLVRTLDNSADMRYYLPKFYPKLDASLGKGAFAREPEMQEQDLAPLRRYIAFNLAGSMASRVRYVAGPAGTLAVLDRAPDGSVNNLRLLESPVMTGARAQAEQTAYDRFGFISDDGRLVLVRGGQVETRSPPIADPASLFLFGERGIILGDDKFNLYTSNDNGSSWQHYAGAAVSEVGDVMLTGGVAEDQDELYVYRRYAPLLFHAPYGSAEYQQLALPKGLEFISSVTARQSGLFLETHVHAWTMSTPNPFYVRLRKSTEWETRYKPQAMCKDIQFLDDTGQRLRVRCNGDVYDSADGGVSWQR